MQVKHRKAWFNKLQTLLKMEMELLPADNDEHEAIKVLGKTSIATAHVRFETNGTPVLNVTVSDKAQPKPAVKVSPKPPMIPQKHPGVISNPPKVASGKKP